MATLLAGGAGAGKWSKCCRDNTNPYFYDFKVCQDGITFAVATVAHTDEDNGAVENPSREGFTLGVRGGSLDSVLSFPLTDIPRIPNPLALLPEAPFGWHPGIRINLAVFTRPWKTGVAPLPLGTQLEGVFVQTTTTPAPLIPGGPPAERVYPQVADCRLFGP